jgi:outer membrane lipoprotein-sorting protein
MRSYLPAKLTLSILIAQFCLSITANLSVSAMEMTSSSQAINQNVVMTKGCDDGSAFIGKMISKASALNNYSCDYKMVVHKQGVVTESGTLYFRKPHLMRVQVTSGSKKGALAILAGDGRVHGHLGGLLKYFSGAVPTDSNFALALNGYPLAGTDFYSLAKYLKEEMLDKGDRSLVSQQPIQTANTDAPTYVLDMIRKVDGKDRLIKRIYVDPQTLIPIYWEDYEQGKLWSQSSWSAMKINQSLPDRLFAP